MTATALSQGWAYTECPRWYRGRLYFVDMYQRVVTAIDEHGNHQVVTQLPGQTGGIGWLPDGRLLVVQQDTRVILRLDPAGLAVHADLSEWTPTMINDMWVDSRGRAYVTEMGFDIHNFLADPDVMTRLSADWVGELPDIPQLARIFVVDPDGSVRVGASALRFPNGIVVDEQRSQLIVAETFGAAITVFGLDADGDLTRTASLPVGFCPDGIAVDVDGNVWACDPVHACAWLIDSAGTRLASVFSEQLCVACAVGGEGGRRLFLCTAPATDPEQCLGARGSRIDVVDLDAATGGPR